jgi:hypothetical protein
VGRRMQTLFFDLHCYKLVVSELIGFNMANKVHCVVFHCFLANYNAICLRTLQFLAYDKDNNWLML